MPGDRMFYRVTHHKTSVSFRLPSWISRHYNLQESTALYMCKRTNKVLDFYIKGCEKCETIKVYRCYRRKENVATFEFYISLRGHEDLKNSHLVFFKLIDRGFRAYFLDIKEYMQLIDLRLIDLKLRAKKRSLRSSHLHIF